MPLFMDVHNLGTGVTIGTMSGPGTPGRPGPPRASNNVSYLRYWVDEGKGQIFCLVRGT